MRLEDFLFLRFSELSRMYLREIVRDGFCQVNGRFENVGYRVRPDDFIEIELDPERSGAMRPENISLDIVSEDDDIIVVNKPPGMLAHPTHHEMSGTLLNALTYHLNKGGRAIRAGLVHRLDKETSGLMVVAKNLRAHRRLAGQFGKKLVGKKYAALVSGDPGSDEGEIDLPIGRFAELKFWDVKFDGKPSLTRFRVSERFLDASLLELEPVTGRTNQLRIHCAAAGHPIVGDVQRGGRDFPRLCLHARSLEFRHPATGEHVRFESPVPPDFFPG